MKEKISIICSFTVLFLLSGMVASSQKNNRKVLDSTLEANSDKWKVKEHKGLGGIAKPEFGTYTTIAAEKLDSPMIKKKTKDSSGASVAYSSYDGWDISKHVTIEKKKFYRMALGREQDTTEVQFYIHSVSAEKRQTVFGKLLSKNDENKEATLNYKKNIEGIILDDSGSIKAHFFVEDYISTRQISNENPKQDAPVTYGFISLKEDSLFTEAVIDSIGQPKDIFFMKRQTGIFINDRNGAHIALLQFGGDKIYIRIHKALDADRQNAVAAFFAAIIGVKDL